LTRRNAENNVGGGKRNKVKKCPSQRGGKGKRRREKNPSVIGGDKKREVPGCVAMGAISAMAKGCRDRPPRGVRKLTQKKRKKKKMQRPLSTLGGPKGWG